MILTSDLLETYASLFKGCEVPDDHLAKRLGASVNASRERYVSVGAPLHIPWYFIGLVHLMESSQRWTTHLHNGDPLSARTVRVPAGRPAAGEPPFTWEESATDALAIMGLDKVSDWSLAGVLYQLERWNGFGYRKHGINTPYLWAGSNQYVAGKFTVDGRFDPSAVSKQIGAAVVLKMMEVV